ncbi:VCBS repeat-containing protein [Euzebyella marina]|uniref:VCBS repeat-containing protein n=1 Tax=Euzebyella marina TaxID=1761453 RepID=A0A3G2LAM0_9FLAO|nr:VCBS repeat-containing protein [Euzebyella marina]AYN69251.1 VCBS repeat-containing protein [Euzebyella marina]
MAQLSFKPFTKTALYGLIFFATCHFHAQKVESGFVKTTITKDFISEGVATADLNNDGRLDIVAGYYWFEAPNWERHEMAPSRSYDPYKEYSESFLNLGMDVNLDGWDDVVIVDYPGKAGFWFENPKNKEGQWPKHIIADSTGISNESPGFVDIDGDGRLDILCGDVDKKQIVWLQAPKTKGETEWKRYPLTKENVSGTEQYSHGIGYGDVDGDGFKDVLVTDGWFKGTADLKSGNWEFHKANLGEPCSHMYVFDVNEDGLNDVLSASAHKLGVWWHQQDKSGSFTTNLITNTTAQTHSSIMVDLDGNGIEDWVTGKRFLAHNGNDAGDADTPFLFWIEFTPEKAPHFKEHIIDSNSGAGLNIAIADMDKNGKPDIVIANKNGVFLFENKLGDKKSK